MWSLRQMKLTSYLLRRHLSSQTKNSSIGSVIAVPDALLCGMDGGGAVSVRVASIRDSYDNLKNKRYLKIGYTDDMSVTDALQEISRRQELSDLAARAIGETLLCTALMASTLKGDETLHMRVQPSVTVADSIGSLEAVGNATGILKGRVEFPKFSPPGLIAAAREYSGGLPLPVLLNAPQMMDGEAGGQLHVIRSHPSWKAPVNGVTALPNGTVSTAVSEFVATSEQRLAAVHTEVQVVGGRVLYALGAWVERLPGAEDSAVAIAVENMRRVTRENGGLAGLLGPEEQETIQKAMKTAVEVDSREGTEEEVANAIADKFGPLPESGWYPPQELSLGAYEVALTPLHNAVDGCLENMPGSITEASAVRWSQPLKFQCSCSIARVTNALQVLPKSELDDIIEKDEGVHMRCEYCGSCYELNTAQIVEVISNRH